MATASASFVIEQDEPVDWPTFARAMETLLALRGGDLLRVKGILNVKGCRGPVVVQYVQHLAHPPVELQSWPDASRASRVVFITRDVAEREVKSLFAAVQALAKGWRQRPTRRERSHGVTSRHGRDRPRTR